MRPWARHADAAGPACRGFGMRSKRVSSPEHGRETLVVVFDKGDEAVAGLTGLARRERLAADQLTTVGGFRRATLGYLTPSACDTVRSRWRSRSRSSHWSAT